MLMALLLALLAGDPVAVEEAGFCRDLKTFTAAASDTPAPFASLVAPALAASQTQIAVQSPRGFHGCSRYRSDRGWTVTCHRRARAPLLEDHARTSKAVAECLDLPPIENQPGWSRYPATVFRSTGWNIVVDTKSCDRCKGMPEVVIRFVATRPD